MANPHGQWVPDELAPSGYRWARHGEQPATSMLPHVTPPPGRDRPGSASPPASTDDDRTGGTVRYDEYQDHQLSGPEHPGGDWANADAYLSYDEVDSTTIVDDGAPA